MDSARIILLLATLGMGVSGCQSVGKAFGAGKNPPDEFAIVTKAPLTVPPDYALRPPKPGEIRPDRLSTADRTRQLLVGDSASQPPSTGELALLQSVGALEVDESIRAILAAENGNRADKDESLANRLAFWQVNDGQIDDSEAPLVVDDESEWHSERQEAIEAVTGGQKVVITKEDRRVLNLPGVN